MNIALLGKGKTGGEVLRLARNRSDVSVTVFDREHPPERSRLAGHDVIISFLPGEPFQAAIPELLASRIPVVTGSTGFEWPGGREAFSRQLKDAGLTWVHANNFSLGMNLVHEMIKILGMAGELYDDFEFSLHEVHHKKKKDAPSGTALTWKEWLDQPVEITSERTGDVIGDHALTLVTPFEHIRVSHSARDRQIFASGALWTAKQVLAGIGDMEPGLYDIQQIALHKLWKEARASAPRINHMEENR
ncbi:MAG: dihydrodipicolinate reductase C-terminal domain-containing protein [Balneolales bacterium]